MSKKKKKNTKKRRPIRRKKLKREVLHKNEPTVLERLQQIKSGELDPGLLDADARRRCVQHLSGEGFSVAEIAQILKRSERTIARDRRTIQEELALQADAGFAGRVAGQLVAEADLSVQRIRRAARDRDAPPAVRVDAERACFTILCQMTERLQSLGYLPTATQRIEAQLHHSAESLPTFEQIQLEVERLETISVSVEDEPGWQRELAALKKDLARGKAAQRLEHARSKEGQPHGTAGA